MKAFLCWTLLSVAFLVNAAAGELARQALADKEFLISDAYLTQLVTAVSSAEFSTRVESGLMLATRAHCLSVDHMFSSYEEEEFDILSNLVQNTGTDTNRWQTWMGRLLYAGNLASRGDFRASYNLSTNSLDVLATNPCSDFTNELCLAFLERYAFKDVSCSQAFEIMSGMAAAQLGWQSAATNAAMRLPGRYRQMIFDYLQ